MIVYRVNAIYYECDIRGVDTRWTVEISEEVAAWYGSLKDADRGYADVALERLADRGPQLRMPHSRRDRTSTAGDESEPRSERKLMARMTLEELQAKYPVADQETYDEARAAALLAGALAELVYAMRHRAGLTQVELARRMGTTQSSIARIEGGGTVPTIEMLARLARTTGIPVRLAAAGVADVEIGAA